MKTEDTITRSELTRLFELAGDKNPKETVNTLFAYVAFIRLEHALSETEQALSETLKAVNHED